MFMSRAGRLLVSELDALQAVIPRRSIASSSSFESSHSLVYRNTARRPFSAGAVRRLDGAQDKGKGKGKEEGEGGSTGSSNVREPFMTRLRSSLNSSPIIWYPIPIGLGIALLVALNTYKQWDRRKTEEEDAKREERTNRGVYIKGPWQVHVMGALPLRTISRIYGAVNSYTLPVWFRVPGYKLYAFLFGVNLEECDPDDLTQYRSLSEFFMRKLKEGARQVDEAALISPADGTVVNFGSIENRRVEQVKGMTYSLDALLSGSGAYTSSTVNANLSTNKDHKVVDEEDFANVNGITYSIAQLMGDKQDDKTKTASGSSTTEPPPSSSRSWFSWFRRPARKPSTSNDEGGQPKDASVNSENGITKEASVALSVGPSNILKQDIPQKGNKTFFCVVYLAPGDYHRFHSPTAWVVERRRHFAGELFSVSPYVANRLADLFVLNERVALLGRWRYGFFSFTAVGATNVGSIRINFDKDLRTNAPNKSALPPGTFSEAVYSNASMILNGQALRPFDEMGGFWLGSTIVLVFEAPEDFEFSVATGEKVKVGQRLGDVRRK